jgi:hypothetical protein
MLLSIVEFLFRLFNNFLEELKFVLFGGLCFGKMCLYARLMLWWTIFTSVPPWTGLKIIKNSNRSIILFKSEKLRVSSSLWIKKIDMIDVSSIQAIFLLSISLIKAVSIKSLFQSKIL